MRFYKLYIALILLVGLNASVFAQCNVVIDTFTNPNCGLDNGMIRLDVSGPIDTAAIGWARDGILFDEGGVEKNDLIEGFYSIVISGSECGDGDDIDPTQRLTAQDSEIPEAQLESVTGETCEGDSDGIALITVNGGEGELSYLWSNGNTSQNALALSPGTYSVTVQDELNCRDTLTDITVPNANVIFIDSLEDVEIFKGGEKQLTPEITGGNGSLSYMWRPLEGISCDGECPQPRVAFDVNTTVSLTVTDESGCTLEASILVTVLDEVPEIFVPSGFTPNADGENDVFQVYGQGIEFMTLTIFDRWGNMVYQLLDQKETWDGNYADGKPAPTGTYVYILEIEYLSEMGIPLPKPVTGNVTLLRN